MLLRALMAGCACSAVAGYTFTTLNPIVGVVHVAEDRSLIGGGDADGALYDETAVEERREQELMASGVYADMPTRNQFTCAGSRVLQIHHR
jgi:GTP-binding protein